MREMTLAMVESLPRVYGSGDFGLLTEWAMEVGHENEFSLYRYASEDRRDEMHGTFVDLLDVVSVTVVDIV